MTLSKQQRWTLAYGVFFILIGSATIAVGNWLQGGFFSVCGAHSALQAFDERLRIPKWVQRLLVIVIVVWGLMLLFQLAGALNKRFG